MAECVQLLVSRAPKPLGPGTDRCGLTQDVVITILACLQPCIGSVEHHTNTVAFGAREILFHWVMCVCVFISCSLCVCVCSTLRLELSEKLRMLINMHGPIPKTRPVPLGPPPVSSGHVQCTCMYVMYMYVNRMMYIHVYIYVHYSMCMSFSLSLPSLPPSLRPSFLFHSLISLHLDSLV